MSEAEIILDMLQHAHKAGPLFEVAECYVHNMKRGKSVSESAYHAMYEWDV